MTPSIDVDDEVLELLKKHAEPFVDTPNSVLRRLTGLDSTTSVKLAHDASEASDRSHKDVPARAATREARVKASPGSSGRTRAASGTLLPEEEYELPLLRALDEMEGLAPYRDVVERVGQLVDDKLTPVDRETLKSGGIRWQSRLQFVRLRLIERGLMDREAPRGLWGITDAGRDALREGRTK